MAEAIGRWWQRRRFSRGADVPYAVGTYREAWASYPVLVRQYRPEYNEGIVLSQIPPAADVYLCWLCDAGHVFVATPEEQRHRPGRERRRSSWCPDCAELASPRLPRAAPMIGGRLAEVLAPTSPASALLRPSRPSAGPSPEPRLAARPACGDSGGMSRLLLGLLTNAVAIWLTTLVVAGVRVDPYEEGPAAAVLTYLLVAVIFGVVNAVVGGVVRVVAFPLYVLTLGLVSFLVNGLLLLLTAWISGLFGFGLVVDGFWWGVLGALVLALVNWFIGLLLRPFLRRRQD
ncbi:phage holin family protein [Rathayibacter sp. AY1F9]|uniref:phage holin family protein n=3 Tax=Rathayibacter TaxID=33886 RepID=UPI0021584359|nr:phage holin family protein [Rathayibacter sp. AY1F9]